MINGGNNKYRNIEKKGEGTFSEVYKAQHVKLGTFHAIKFMKETYRSMDEVNELKEIDALRKLSPHPNIIKLQDVLYDRSTRTLGIVFELMDKNLYELISGRRSETDRPFDSSYTTNLAYQLFTAIEHIHSLRIFHRDIKPENILVNEATKTLKLADFGSCRGCDVAQPVTGYIATRWYRAPENLLTDGHYGQPMDVWGAGSVLYEFISLYPLFSGSNEVDQLNRIHKVLGTPSARVLDKLVLKAPYDTSFGFPVRKGVGIRHFIPHVSLDCVDLITKTLTYDFTKRITAKKVLSHAYFNAIRVKEKTRLFQKKSRVTSPKKSKTKSSSSIPNPFRPRNKTTGKNKTKARKDKANANAGNAWEPVKEDIVLNASSSSGTKTTARDSLQSSLSTSELLTTNTPSPNKYVHRRRQRTLSTNEPLNELSAIDPSSKEILFKKSLTNLSSLKESPTNVTSFKESPTNVTSSIERRTRSKTKQIPPAFNSGDNSKNKLKKYKEPARRKIVVNPKQIKQAPSNAIKRTTSVRRVENKIQRGSSSTRTSFQKSSTTQAKTMTQSKAVKPAKFVRPNPGSRYYGGNPSTVTV